MFAVGVVSLRAICRVVGLFVVWSCVDLVSTGVLSAVSLPLNCVVIRRAIEHVNYHIWITTII